VAISHFHADHFSDISSFFVHLKYHPIFGYQWSGVAPNIPVWGPSDIEEKLLQACSSIDSSTGVRAFSPNIWVTQIPVHIGPITIVPYQVYHSVESFGMRFIGPSALRGGQLATIAYSGDTDYCENVVSLARDSDLFLCEASYLVGRDDKSPPGIHITGKGAGRVAREADAKKLLLVHIPSWNNPNASLAEARTEYDGPIEIAKTNGVFEV
jgi:ribonuclease BN (tRNA processing enzyme)